MPKTLSYADAMRILGQGPESDHVRRLNDLTGGILLGATVTGPAVLGWFDAHARFAELSQQLAKAVGKRLTGAHRLDRADRIAAAHTVIVVAAYFEALADAGLPFGLPAAGLSAGDQWRLAGGEDGSGPLARAALRVAVGLPEPHGFRDEYLDSLAGTYRNLSVALSRFLRGLAVWDSLGPGGEERVERALAEVPRLARDRYERLLLDLQADCPEVALWIRDRDSAVLLSSVREMGELMRRVAVPVTAARVPELFTLAYGALLDRPVVEAGDLPAGLDVPTLRAAYVPPLYRITEALADAPAGDERFWAERPVRADLHTFLTGFLTSPRARRAPLLVLGQPGAGKSVLTRVLAAELSEGGFLPVRVPLRDVDTSLDLQRQIEQAVQATTTEAITWPRLAEAAGGRLPVVLLDGFDELLQATATSQTDYLYRVADFQQRERDLGRAVAFVVTTRTSVADRAAPPPETLALRLEPFDAERVTRWLDVWNGLNAEPLRALGRQPLPAQVALRFPGLAGQPLLLLLLALYDADGNALQHTGTLSESELYERLLAGFAGREVRKARPHLAEHQQAREVELELHRLSVVAFAMLNRSAQWVSERDLDSDLTAIFGAARRAAGDDGINAATLLLGRFFFVHRARAVRGRDTLQTYEFLHATFGEYLIARYTWQLLGETVARASVTVTPSWNADDGALSRLLSFAPLSGRAPIVRFIKEMAARLSGDDRRAWTDALTGLYRRSQDAAWLVQSGEYRPTALRTPARYGVYTANLVLLSVIVAGDLRFSEFAELDGLDAGNRWHGQALLWHSQLSNPGWQSMVHEIAVIPCRTDSGARDVRLRPSDAVSEIHPVDPRWLYDRPEAERNRSAFADVTAAETHRHLVQFNLCAVDNSLLRTVTPLIDSPLAISMSTYCGWFGDDCPSAAEALMRVWLLPTMQADHDTVRETYLACARIAAYRFPPWSDTTHRAYVGQLLRALESDTVPPDVAADVIETLLDAPELNMRALIPLIFSVARKVLSGDPAASPRLAARCLALAEAHRGRQWSEPDLRTVLTALRTEHRRPGAVPRPEPATHDEPSADGMYLRLTGLLPRMEEMYQRAEELEADLTALADEFDGIARGSASLAVASQALAAARTVPRQVEALLAYAAHRIDVRGGG